MGDMHEPQNCVITMSSTAKATQENGLLWGGGGGQMLLVDFYFYYFVLLGRGLPASSQINHTERLFLIYKYPALAWLISYQLF